MKENENNLQLTAPDGVPSHVHMLGICGVGMVGLARLFLSAGSSVTGTDQSVYPPMSLQIREMGIDIREGYKPENLQPGPDLAIVGNVIRSENPEAMELARLGIPFTSMAGALENYFLKDKIRIVATGTHGKTTCTSMISWILFDQGLDPSFFVGGIPRNFDCSSRLGNGRFFVIEGDEYDTAYFDKNPKFLHYRPDIAVITSVEFDHADIYRDVDQIKLQFSRLADIVPEKGTIIACSDYQNIRDVTQFSHAQVDYYGAGNDCKWSLGELSHLHEGVFIQIRKYGKTVCEGTVPVFGVHNAMNTLASVAVAAKLGVDPVKAMDSMGKFRGVRRRQQVYDVADDITLIDDFAHHPTEVRLTCEAVKARFPDRRLVCVFEPRTNTSRRSFFQKDYVTSFLSADLVILRDAAVRNVDKDFDIFDSSKLAADLKAAGKQAHAFADAGEILNHLSNVLVRKDVALIMSNGNFEGLLSGLIDLLNGVKK